MGKFRGPFTPSMTIYGHFSESRSFWGCYYKAAPNFEVPKKGAIVLRIAHRTKTQKLSNVALAIFLGGGRGGGGVTDSEHGTI